MMGYYFIKFEITPFKAKGLRQKEKSSTSIERRQVTISIKFEITHFKDKGLH